MAGFFRRLVSPAQPMPRAPDVMATPIADVLTNIGATDIAHPGVATHIQQAVRQRYGLPTAANLDETQPDPEWISRWQESPDPDGVPWVKGYRWWVPHVHYQNWYEGGSDYFRIDILWADHAHAYWDIPRPVWDQFRRWTGSVGRWVIDNLLVAGWNGKSRRGSRYPDREISR